MKQKEIGGYFELGNFPGNEYYPNLHKINLGRCALLLFLRQMKADKLRLPYFICDSLIYTCRKNGYSPRFYRIDENFLPSEDIVLDKGEYMLLVNYYGQLSDDVILRYFKKYKRIIVDNTHSFFQRPMNEVPTFYSCRKYFGVPDGAYLACEGRLPKLEKDRSAKRMSHILGRYENCASSYYDDMLDTAGSFYDMPAMSMSVLTENLLKGTDYEKAKNKRNINYKFLTKRLNRYNQKEFRSTDGPFCFPFYHTEADHIRKSLIENKIYVPVYWKNVINDMPKESIEYDFAMHILPIPCDQRYDISDMETVVKILTGILKTP